MWSFQGLLLRAVTETEKPKDHSNFRTYLFKRNFLLGKDFKFTGKLQRRFWGSSRTLHSISPNFSLYLQWSFCQNWEINIGKLPWSQVWASLWFPPFSTAVLFSVPRVQSIIAHCIFSDIFPNLILFSALFFFATQLKKNISKDNGLLKGIPVY